MLNKINLMQLPEAEMDLKFKIEMTNCGNIESVFDCAVEI